MKSIDRDEFIYNYFEGNLSSSELELFIELKETNVEFADQVSRWKATYFNKNISTVGFSRKELVYKNNRKWIVGGVFLFMTGVIVYLFNSNYQLNKRTERIENELLNNKKTEKVERGATSLVGLNNKIVEPVSPLFDADYLPMSLPRSFKEKPTKPNKNEEVELLVVIDSIVKERVTEGIIIDTILPKDSSSIDLDTPVLVEEEVELKEPNKTKKVKKRKRFAKWSDIKKVYKHQEIVPLE